MVSQPTSFTNYFSRYWAKVIFNTHRASASVLVSGLLAGLLLAAPAQALVKMDAKAVDAALVYGMKNQDLGMASLLGSNWVEGPNGALLNVYSPFMMVASKAAKANFSKRPTQSDLKKARQRFGKEVAFYSDLKNAQRIQVKFAVSFYGNSIDFAKDYTAKIVGFGRGKEFELKPAKQLPDQKADPVANGVSGASYEAINSYYFGFGDLENLEEFTLELSSPTGPPLRFRMRNDHLY